MVSIRFWMIPDSSQISPNVSVTTPSITRRGFRLPDSQAVIWNPTPTADAILTFVHNHPFGHPSGNQPHPFAALDLGARLLQHGIVREARLFANGDLRRGGEHHVIHPSRIVWVGEGEH